jgi:hypothetical protein
MNHGIINNLRITYGCIHNLESECIIVNEKLGDCGIQDDITNITVWKCPFYFSRIDEVLI